MLCRLLLAAGSSKSPSRNLHQHAQLRLRCKIASSTYTNHEHGTVHEFPIFPPMGSACLMRQPQGIARSRVGALTQAAQAAVADNIAVTATMTSHECIIGPCVSGGACTLLHSHKKPTTLPCLLHIGNSIGVLTPEGIFHGG